MSGIFLSFSLKDGQYFERFGSLIVIVGIIVAWRDFTGKFDEIENLVGAPLKAELFNLNTDVSKGLLSQGISRARKDELSELSKQLKGLFEILRNRIRAIEAITLILGTFILGFGSLLFNLAFKTNA